MQVQPSSTNPTEIVSDGESVYWLNSSTYTDDALNADGAIWRLSLSTGAATKLISKLTLEMDSVAVGGGKLYFATPQQVLSIPLPNGALSPTQVAAGRAGTLVADDQAVNWTDNLHNEVLRCPHSGCDSPEVVAATQAAPGALTQDSNSIYWTSPGGATAAVLRLTK